MHDDTTTIINSETRFGGFKTYCDKNFGEKGLIRLFLHFTYQSTQNPVFRKRHFFLAAAGAGACRGEGRGRRGFSKPRVVAAWDKGGLAQAACRGGVGQAQTWPKCRSWRKL